MGDVRARRIPVAATAVAVVLVAGGALVGLGARDREPSDVAVVAAPPTTIVTTAAPTTSAVPAVTAVTTTEVPRDPYESLVATIKPEVSVLETFAEPDTDTPVHFEFAVTNPTYFGQPQTLLVLEGDADDRWLRVQLPVRPNHSTAWIRAADVTLSTHTFHGLVDVSDRTVKFFDRDELLIETVAVVGRDNTPTPLGRFYVNEMLPQASSGGAYGPYIFSLSAFSETLDTFNGGIPVIALHGTNHPELIGQARSNGCIRMPNEIAEQLAATIPPGTPVEIVA